MTPPSPIVGIIANPASGRDLRRLTAHAGLHSSTDKASVVQRLLAAFGATGIRHALLPPDMTGIAAAVLRASQTRQARDGHWPFLEFLDMPLRQSVEDTRLAARRMVERGVALIAVLGGDGTHKQWPPRSATSRWRCPPGPTTPSRSCAKPPARGSPAASAPATGCRRRSACDATSACWCASRAGALRVGAGGRRGVAATVHRRPRHQSRRRPRRSLRQLRRTPRHRPFGALRTVVAGEPRGAHGAWMRLHPDAREPAGAAGAGLLVGRGLCRRLPATRRGPHRACPAGPWRWTESARSSSAPPTARASPSTLPARSASMCRPPSPTPPAIACWPASEPDDPVKTTWRTTRCPL